MSDPRYPSLYQINTRVWLTELSRTLGRPATLDDIPDAELDRLAEHGVRLGLVPERLADRPGRAAGLAQPTPSGARNFRRRCRTCARRTSPAPGSRSPATRCIATSAAMRRWPGCASGFAQRGLRLMLDFVPNHTGLDHPWVEEHPEYYVPGTELDLARAPQNYTWVKRKRGDLLLAYGRDPYFPAGRTRCSSTTATRPRRKR